MKDETGNVAGSHKAAHLVSILLHLKAAELLGVGPEDPPWPSPVLRQRRAGRRHPRRSRPPGARGVRAPWANPAIVGRAHRLRAIVTVCPAVTTTRPAIPASPVP